MRHNKLEKELELMLLMTENHDYTVEQLCDKLGVSRRNLYYYLEFFSDSGFIVEKRGVYYRLDKESPFFRKLYKTLHFTEDEALTIRRLLDKADDSSIQVQYLKKKLDKIYDLDILDDIKLKQQSANNINTLYDAIKFKNKAVLHNYSSPHSNTISNRIVEPFMFMNGNNEIRCYEITSSTNKTFKISRIESVEMLSDGWEYEKHHKQMYTDIFMFSSEQRYSVKLRMRRLAYNILIEEYPHSIEYITQEDENNWILDINVCSYKGISRFVLGLYEYIDILGSNDFIQFINEKIMMMTSKTKTLL